MASIVVNIKHIKKCAFCKNWYDPTNSAIAPKAPTIGKRAIKKVAELAGKELLEFAEKELNKNHGSKVKKGCFEECKITLVGTKACIYLGNNNYRELTDENVKKITFIKEKHKIDHTYFYYEIEFQDGRSSYVRMRRKYRDAMYEHCSCI